MGEVVTGNNVQVSNRPYARVICWFEELGLVLYFAQGNIDKHGVFYRSFREENGRMVVYGREEFMYDHEFLGELLELSKKYGRQRMYFDFVHVYGTVPHRHEGMPEDVPSVDALEYIRWMCEKHYEAQDVPRLVFVFTVFYAAMMADENKENSVLGKLLKRHAAADVLLMDKDPRVAARMDDRKGKERIRQECNEIPDFWFADTRDTYKHWQKNVLANIAS